MRTLVEWFIPQRLAKAPDAHRKACITVVFSFAMLVNTIPNIIVLFSGGVKTVGFLVVAVAFIQLLTPFVLRQTGSLALAAHFLVTGAILDNLACTALSGGLESPGFVWWGPYVIFAIMVLGVRVGLLWTVILVAVCVTYLVLWKQGIAIRNDVARLDRKEALMSSYVSAFIAFFLLVRSYENLKTRMLREIEKAQASLQAAHDSARLVLDNVSQGLVLVSPAGRMDKEGSRALASWFGLTQEGADFFTYIGRVNQNFAERLRVAWSTIFDDVLPMELVLEQLPARFEKGGRHFGVTYHPIGQAGAVSSVLVVFSDVSAQVVAAQAREEQQDALSIFRHVSEERDLFLGFLGEARARVARLLGPALDSAGQLREVHTLKGNLGLFGFARSVRFLHELEDMLVNDARGMTEEERSRLNQHWQTVEEMIGPLLGDASGIQVSKDEYHAALAAVANGEPHSVLLGRMKAWSYEPVRKRFALLSRYVVSLASRLGKPGPTVSISDGGMRLPREPLAAFWAVLPHVIRNAVDHGFEAPDERRAHAKPAECTVQFISSSDPDGITIAIADDGRGIDWEEVGKRARKKGLPAETREELEAALFADGVSTKNESSDISGRGVGLGAVRAVVLSMGGSIRIESASGRGTRFSFQLKLGTGSDASVSEASESRVDGKAAGLRRCEGPTRA